MDSCKDLLPVLPPKLIHSGPSEFASYPFQRSENEGSPEVDGYFPDQSRVDWLYVGVAGHLGLSKVEFVDDSAFPMRGEDGAVTGAAFVFCEITEKKQTEQALRDQEQRASVILESITEAFFALDKEWRFTYVNGPAGRLLERPTSSLLGRTLWEEYPGVLGSVFESVYRNAMDKQQPGSITAYFPDHECFYEVHTYPAPDGISVYFQDVSDRKRVEAEREMLLRQVEAEGARLAEIFRHAPSFMCVLSGPHHVFERANDRYRELIGGRDVVGRTVREALPEVEGQGYFEMLETVFQTGEPYIGTDHLVKLERNGRLEERVVDFVYQPLRAVDGSVTGVLLQGIDLTERKKAEAEVARVIAESDRRRRMFETALSNTPDFVYLFDLEGRFTFINKALLDLWQKDAAEAVGKTFSELDYPPELAARLQRQIQEVIRTVQPLRDETPNTRAIGTRAYEYIFEPVLGSDGEVEAVAGSTRDITNRKESEAALRRADRQKDDFLALLAHELRNPLAPIRNGLQVTRLS